MGLNGISLLLMMAINAGCGVERKFGIYKARLICKMHTLMLSAILCIF